MEQGRLKKAELDPDKAPTTWPDTLATALNLRAAGIPCGLTAARISWTHIEQFSAWHNIAMATKANGLEGAAAVLEFNNPIAVKHSRNLAEAQKDKSFDYGGRPSEPEGKFLNGELGMIQTSSAAFGIFKAGAKFDFYQGRLRGYHSVGVLKASGFYEKNPGREIPIMEMTAKPPTKNSRGLRLGNLVQIRDIITEDLEAAFAGKEDAQPALDDAAKRGNGLLRQFARNTEQ